MIQCRLLDVQFAGSSHIKAFPQVLQKQSKNHHSVALVGV